MGGFFIVVLIIGVVVLLVKAQSAGASPRSRSQNPLGWDDSYLAYVGYTAALRNLIKNPQDKVAVEAAIKTGVEHYAFFHSAVLPKDRAGGPEMRASMVRAMSQTMIEMDLKTALSGEMPAHLTNKRNATSSANAGGSSASARPAPTLDEPDEEQRRRVLAEPLVTVGKVELLEGCDRIPGSSGRFGYDLTNPIPVNGAGGELVYLNTLRARSGVGLLYHRIRSDRTPGYPHPIDVFEVVATDASQWARLHFAMYHPRRTREAPGGFDRKPWGELADEIKAMVHFPAMGVTSCVEDFPLGLPSAVRSSGMLKSLSPGLAESMANGVQRILDRHEGAWTRPDEVTSGAPKPPDRSSDAARGGEQWYVESIAKYRLTKEDMQPMATIAAFAWKYVHMTRASAVEYAMYTIYLSRHGTPQERKDADTTWQSAIQWSIDAGLQSLQWGMECIDAVRRGNASA